MQKAEEDILTATLGRDRRGAERRLRQAQATIARQIQLRDASADIKRPEQGTGFAGGDGSGGGVAETIKDITAAQAAAKIKEIQTLLELFLVKRRRRHNITRAAASDSISTNHYSFSRHWGLKGGISINQEIIDTKIVFLVGWGGELIK